MKKLCPKLFLLLAPSVFVLYVLVIFLMFKGKADQAENIANQTTGAESECETLGKSEPETEATQAASNTDKTETSDWMLVLVNFQNPIEGNPEIEFTELSGDSLYNAIITTVDNKQQLKSMSESLRSFKTDDACQRIYDLMLKMSNNKKSSC